MSEPHIQSNFTKVDLNKYFISSIERGWCSIIRIDKVTEGYVICQHLHFPYGEMWNNKNLDCELAKTALGSKYGHRRWDIMIGSHSYINKNRYRDECTLLIPTILGIKVQPKDKISTNLKRKIIYFKNLLPFCPEDNAFIVDEDFEIED